MSNLPKSRPPIPKNIVRYMSAKIRREMEERMHNDALATRNETNLNETISNETNLNEPSDSLKEIISNEIISNEIIPNETLNENLNESIFIPTTAPPNLVPISIEFPLMQPVGRFRDFEDGKLRMRCRSNTNIQFSLEFSNESTLLIPNREHVRHYWPVFVLEFLLDELSHVWSANMVGQLLKRIPVPCIRDHVFKVDFKRPGSSELISRTCISIAMAAWIHAVLTRLPHSSALWLLQDADRVSRVFLGSDVQWSMTLHGTSNPIFVF